MAATLEPNRAILNSYLGKAFSAVGNIKSANMDLKRAKELDPKDPTPYLYSAIEDKQENRYNEAVRNLEQSLNLNDNRSVYRSRFLLDQDKAVSGTNLAAIYLNENMIDQSVREAIESVNSDYASASAQPIYPPPGNDPVNPRHSSAACPRGLRRPSDAGGRGCCQRGGVRPEPRAGQSRRTAQ